MYRQEFSCAQKVKIGGINGEEKEFDLTQLNGGTEDWGSKEELEGMIGGK